MGLLEEFDDAQFVGESLGLGRVLQADIWRSRCCGNMGEEESLDVESRGGHFLLFCDDLRLTNMLVDPATQRITTILDWEFTNAMSSQFAEDVSWWLLLRNPARWISGRVIKYLPFGCLRYIYT